MINIPQNARLYLERLRPVATLKAITYPLDVLESPIRYADSAADTIVRALRSSYSTPSKREFLSEYVEPVYLQIVCKAIWEQATARYQADAQNNIISGDQITGLISATTAATISTTRWTTIVIAVVVRRWTVGIHIRWWIDIGICIRC